MKRYITEMKNDLIREYPNIDREKLERNVSAYRRGMISLRDLLRVFAETSDETAYRGKPLTLDLSVLWN